MLLKTHHITIFFITKTRAEEDEKNNTTDIIKEERFRYIYKVIYIIMTFLVVSFSLCCM